MHEFAERFFDFISFVSPSPSMKIHALNVCLQHGLRTRINEIDSSPYADSFLSHAVRRDLDVAEELLELPEIDVNVHGSDNHPPFQWITFAGGGPSVDVTQRERVLRALLLRTDEHIMNFSTHRVDTALWCLAARIAGNNAEAVSELQIVLDFAGLGEGINLCIDDLENYEHSVFRLLHSPRYPWSDKRRAAVTRYDKLREEQYEYKHRFLTVIPHEITQRLNGIGELWNIVFSYFPADRVSCKGCGHCSS